ncbi:anti-sigma factor family protein [Actinomadura scrupuli]|uniref:anti-sigma factor family protein n=1 Tax=Actinomadura scrupuli TaxID=559629 RepID=UPI003D97AED7
MNSSMMGPCPQVRSALGVYVLGAIDPAERSQVDAHLSMCPNCRDELAGLAGLPALLGRVSEPQIEHVAGPPVELLDSLLAKAATRRRSEQDQAELAERELAELRTRRARWRRWPSFAVAAAALLVAGVLLGGLLTGGLPGVGGGGSSGGVGASADQIVGTDPSTHVRAEISLATKDWGTALKLRVKGVPPGSHCHLTAVARNGDRDVAASWQIEPDEYEEYSFYGSTMILRNQLRSFEIVTTDGRTLVSVPVGT